jgi:hypothetical protein
MRFYPFSHVAPIAPRSFMLRVRQMVGACRCTGNNEVVDALLQALADIHREQTGRAVMQFDVCDVQRVPGSLEPGPRTLLVGGVDVFHGDALLDYINLTSRRYSVHHSSLFLGLIRIG